MKILHVVPTYLPAVRYGGPIYSVHGLCRALARAGHDVHVFTTTVDGPGDSPVPVGRPLDLEGVKVWYFRASALRRIYHSSGMKKALADQIAGFDLVHNHSVFLWPTWAAARRAADRGVPYFVSPRGMLVEELIRRKSFAAKKLWIRFIERKNIERASAVHLTTAAEKEALLRLKLKLPRLFVIPNGVEPPAAEGEPSEAVKRAVSARGPYVLFLGRVNWKKGLEELVSAMRSVPAEARLVIAGNDEEGYRAKIEKLAAQSGLSSRVEFLGPVYGADKAALFEGAGCFALASRSENFGNAVIEAMLCRRPVVVAPGVGVSDFVRASGGGFVTDGTIESLGRALSELVSKPGEARAMGERGEKAARASFGWDSAAAAMVRAYEEILGKGRV